jgi:hypothetical protein
MRPGFSVFIVHLVFVPIISWSCHTIRNQDIRRQDFSSRETDSLEKYSYYVSTFLGGGTTSGLSGFFVRRNNRLFFITNYHATGFDWRSGRQIAEEGDSAKIRFIGIVFGRNTNIHRGEIIRADQLVKCLNLLK